MEIQKLERKLKNARDQETRLDLLDQIAAYCYEKEDFQRAAKYYQQAEALSPAGNARAYYKGQAGICRYLLHQDVQAMELLSAASGMFQPQATDFSPQCFGAVHFFLGSVLEFRGKPDEALSAWQESFKFFDHLSPEIQWMLMAGLGRRFEEKGENQKAIEYFERALCLIRPDDPELCSVYESLGIAHYNLEHYKRALEYFSRTLKLQSDLEELEELHVCMGLCYHRLRDFRQALECFLKSLETGEKNRTRESTCWLYIEIAHCFYQLKEHDKSLEFVQRALKQPIERKEELAEIRSYLTNNFHALGKFEEAVREGEKTLKISRDFHNIGIMLSSLALSYYQLNRKDKFTFYRDWCNRAFPDFSLTKQLNQLEV
ncbi:MAG: tetratricopeptide repeat protein [Acidobacteria bacterium]|nr:tetratricopeptide repeat protein [Acidobacteriota bacterium]